MKNKKELILNHLYQIINEKIEFTVMSIKSAVESRDSDTKSSAGDKYETGREMMQIEIDKNKTQLINAKYLKNELTKIDGKKEFTKAEFGSLVITNQGDYFLSIGLGKIVINDETIYVISMESPIGKQLQNKHIGDTFQFQGKQILVKDIL